jgi:hypothetical protein
MRSRRIEWGPRVLDVLRRLPEAQDIAADRETNAAAVTAVIARDAGRALRNRAPTNRRHALRRFRAVAQAVRTQPGPIADQYRVILEVSPELPMEPEHLKKSM